MRLLLVAVTVLALATPTSAQVPPLSSPFAGGVPTGTASNEPLSLSLSETITRALEHNLGVLTADEAMEAARGARWRAPSELLPNLNGRVTQTQQKLSLAAFGI